MSCVGHLHGQGSEALPFWDCLFLAQSLVGNVLLQLCGAAIDGEHRDLGLFP